MTDIAALRREYILVMSADFNRDSRFYREDMQSLEQAARTKTPEQLREHIAFRRAVDNVTDAEIHAHCQLGGLPKLGREYR
jgi:hypothetical protein